MHAEPKVAVRERRIISRRIGLRVLTSLIGISYIRFCVQILVVLFLIFLSCLVLLSVDQDAFKSILKMQDKNTFQKYLEVTRYYTTIMYVQDEDTIFKIVSCTTDNTGRTYDQTKPFARCSPI